MRAANENAKPFDAMILANLSDWCRSNAVPLCVLYGSRARGTARGDSDTDLAIWVRPLPEATLMLRWRSELSEITRTEVQLVFVNEDLDPVLGAEIMKWGLLLHTDDPDRWTIEKVRLWQQWQDALPLLRAEREELKRFVEDSRHGA